MKARLVRIGNSQGICIPKRLLEQAGLRGEVETTVEEGSLLIRPVAKARAGWAAAFQEMAKHGDDAPIDQGSPRLTTWDDEEWDW